MDEHASEGFPARLRRIPLVEKILASIALAILVGWVIQWSRGDWQVTDLFLSWFATLSFFGALAVAAIVVLKVSRLRPLPPRLEKHAIPVASLVPVAGFLIDLLGHMDQFLTIGGSIALAYISGTTYWRNHIPRIAMNPLGDHAAMAPGEDTSARTAAEEERR